MNRICMLFFMSSSRPDCCLRSLRHTQHHGTWM